MVFSFCGFDRRREGQRRRLTRFLPSRSQVKVLDGEDEYYKLLSAVEESIPEEENPTSAPARPL